MPKEWIIGVEGKNLKFKHETLLNYAMNRWKLNQSYSVGKTSELIRTCAPSEYEEWEEFYFSNAKQKKKKGISITRQYITALGQTLYTKLSEVVLLIEFIMLNYKKPRVRGFFIFKYNFDENFRLHDCVSGR